MARGVNFEHESGLPGPGVANPMDAPASDHGGVARSQHSVLASTAEPDRAGQDLEALVLAQVEMPGNEAAGFEADLSSQRPPLGIGCGLEKGQVLAGQRILDAAVCCRQLSALLGGGTGALEATDHCAAEALQRAAGDERKVGPVPQSRRSGHEATGATGRLSGALGVSSPAMRKTIAPTIAGTPMALWTSKLTPLM